MERKVAIHEAGHAVAQFLTEHSSELDLVSIIPTEDTLGYATAHTAPLLSVDGVQVERGALAKDAA